MNDIRRTTIVVGNYEWNGCKWSKSNYGQPRYFLSRFMFKKNRM